jgi:membrane protease YdiL (CAAX protease family)
MVALLLPLILVAQSHGVQVPIWQQGCVVLVATLLCQALRNQPASEALGGFNRFALFQLLAGAVAGTLLMAVPAAILFVSGSVTWTVSSAGAQNIGPAFWLFAAVAVTEELMFRGFLFRRLVDGLGEWVGQGVAACFFLLVHLDALNASGGEAPLAWVNIFVASFMFGFACLRTGGLAMPIGLHLLANLVQGSVLGFGVSGGAEEGLLVPHLSGPQWWTGGAFGLEASAPGLACVLALTLFLWSRPGPSPASA